jgi:hypothetical protein
MIFAGIQKSQLMKTVVPLIIGNKQERRNKAWNKILKLP